MHRTLLTGICLVPFLFATPALAADPRVATMSLQGNATIRAEPDMATVTTGVVTTADTARTALSANNEAMANLLDLVKSVGVADRDMQTSNFSVAPQYVYSDKPDVNGYRRPPKLVGYQVTNDLTVNLRDLNSLGTVLDKMVSAGSNTINGISFAVSDSSTLIDDARRAAMKDAIAKADLYAKAAGVCLDRIVSISENGGYTPAPLMMKSMAADVAMPAVPVATGEVGYSMSVSVDWEISNGPCE